MLEVSARDLELVEGVIQVKGYPSRRVRLAELASRLETAGRSLEVSEAWEAEGGGSFAGGAHAAIVDVDLDTGVVTVERYVVVHDCGTVINPTIVDGQVHGGVIHGIGNALGERMAYDDSSGQLVTGSFASYQFPEIGSAPPMEVVHHEMPSPNNPEGIKGAGEGGTIGSLATIARAVEDALSEFGVEINHLPIEPAWIAGKLRGPRLRVTSTSGSFADPCKPCHRSGSEDSTGTTCGQARPRGWYRRMRGTARPFAHARDNSTSCPS